MCEALRVDERNVQADGNTIHRNGDREETSLIQRPKLVLPEKNEVFMPPR